MLSRKKQRSEIRERRRQNAKQTWKKRQQREENLKTFLENDESTDIYGWQDAEGFGVETDTVETWIDSTTGVMLRSDQTTEEQEILKEMGFDYNLSVDEKRFEKLSGKYGEVDENGLNTFSWSDYDNITNILGNDLYLILKETGYFDSDQIIDMMLQFEDKIQPEDIERALLGMIEDINQIEHRNVQTVLDAMDLGFTLEEALELTEVDILQNLMPIEGISEIESRIAQEIAASETKRNLEQELREKGEQFRRRN